MKTRKRFVPNTWVIAVLAVAALVLVGVSSTAWASEAVNPAAAAAAAGAEAAGALKEDATHAQLPMLFWIAPIGSVLALAFAFYFHKKMLSAPAGNAVQIGIAANVREGAMAYLFRQYKVLAMFFIVVALLLAFAAFVLKVQHWLVPFAFLTGGFFSGLCGWLGMNTATQASSRTSTAATDADGLNKGLQVAFRSGAVMGLTVVGFGLIDICGWFLLLKFGAFGAMTLETITVVMLCFGMGASSQALFARVGGGIFTKAADVGGDLVGKVEAGIPEDDPRNPATIADNVGDNVGDVAGMGADLYESYCGSILAAAALGVAAVALLMNTAMKPIPSADEVKAMPAARQAEANAAMAPVANARRLLEVDPVKLQSPAAAVAHKIDWQIKFLALPMIIAGVGIALSILGVFLVRTKEGATFADLMIALGKPVWITSVLIAIVTVGLTFVLLGSQFIGVGIAGIVGLAAGVWIGNRTEYFTSYDFKPTQEVSKASEYGPATVIIQGIACGMMATIWPVITIIVAIVLAYGFAGGFNYPSLGLYGIALSAVGMLSTLGYTLATDAYGPIADNAGGNSEMSGLPHTTRERTDLLDALGNTTAATGKGFAIGSAALTAMALIAAYLEEVRVGLIRAGETIVRTVTPVSDSHVISNVELALSKPEITKQLSSLGLTLQPSGDFTMNVSGGQVPVQFAEFSHFMAFYDITLMNPTVYFGLFLGGMLAFAFCAMTMKAVGRAASRMVEEVRRQFRTIPGIMDYKPGDNSPENQARKPHYALCVDIATQGAQREMIVPSVMAVVVPIIIGILLGVAGVVGLLAGAMVGGFVLAVMMAASGGAWDNAKKWIEKREKIKIKDLWSNDPEANKKIEESEKVLGYTSKDQQFRTKFSKSDPNMVIDAANNVKLGDIWNDPAKFHKYLTDKPELWDYRPERIIDGKRSWMHAAGVVGDTVGDPFKDTSGPSLNILIKLMSMVAVVFAGVTALYGTMVYSGIQGLFRGMFGG